MTVAQGCGCNQRFLNLAANFGHPRAEVIAGEYDLTLHSPLDIRLAFLHLPLGIATQAYVPRHSSLEVLHYQSQGPQQPEPIPWQNIESASIHNGPPDFLKTCHVPLQATAC
jgi:hypothetical protein